MTTTQASLDERLDAARADGQVLLAVAEQMANLTYVAWAELLLASVDERTGQLRHAEARVRRAASLYRSNGMQAYLPVALGMLAAIRADLDDPETTWGVDPVRPWWRRGRWTDAQ